MIEFRMLGEIRLRAPDGTDLDALLRQPKRLALLAYLASPAPGTWHRRDMVLALFWPELDTARARTSLRNGLYVLRQTLGEEVIRNRGDEEISVDPQRLGTDVSRVWSALKNHDLDKALAEYGGELLPGLFPSDSDGFLRWLDSERTRLKTAVCASATERLNELERERKPEQALPIARRVIEIQPDDETVVRRVMALYDAVGDRAGALAVFESYRSRLSTDFDAEPAPETIALATRLRTATAPPAKRSAAPGKANGETSRAPFVTPEIVETPKRASRKWLALAGLAVALLAGVVATRMWSADAPPAIGPSLPLTIEEGLQIEAAISPNGRMVAYAKGNPNRLRIFVQRIGGGAAWPLSPDSTETQLLPRWSPDSDEILFLARNSAYASPSIGGTPRLVAKGADGDGMVHSASWSPTGDSVAIVRGDSLLVKAVDENRSRFVGKAYQLHSCVWSPNGKWIACVSGNVLAFTPGPLFGNEAQSAVVLFPTKGGAPIDLTGNRYEHKSPAWTADGKFLWLLSNRDGVSGEAYSIRIGDEGPDDAPLVRVGLNAEWLSLSQSRLAYSVPVRKSNIWSVPLPRDTALTLTAAKAITSGNQVIELVTVSRDGKWLVYDSNVRGNADIYRMPVGGGSAERLTTNPEPEYAAELSWKGDELAWHKWANGRRRIFVKRLDSDKEQEITAVTVDAGVPRWTRDGNSIVGWSHAYERGGVFLLRRDAKGTWKKIWNLDAGQLPVWSPDEKTIAFVLLDGTIQTIPVDSGALRPLYTPRSKTDPIAVYLSWRGTGDTIYFEGDDQTGRSGLWSLPLRTGKPKLIVHFDVQPGVSYGPGFSFDGNRFYFALMQRFANVRWAELR